VVVQQKKMDFSEIARGREEHFMELGVRSYFKYLTSGT